MVRVGSIWVIKFDALLGRMPERDVCYIGDRAAEQQGRSASHGSRLASVDGAGPTSRRSYENRRSQRHPAKVRRGPNAPPPPSGRVIAALADIANVLPFPLLVIDSDNGSEFINHHLLAWCDERKLTFTGSSDLTGQLGSRALT